MSAFWALCSLDLMGYACIFAIGCLCGWSFRKPTVEMPERDVHGKFLPWKKKESA